jgi:2-alkyl-3-oxoalkanoate reductase
VRIFVAGASGAIGRRLVPLLVSAGHVVIGTTRSEGKLDRVRELGAEPVLLDGLNRDAVASTVGVSRPDVIVHQMSALASMRSFKRFDAEFGLTNRLRTEGTCYLLEAAAAAGVRTFVAQSYTGWPNERRGARTKTEADPLETNPPGSMARTIEAIRGLERMVWSAPGITGVVLRYGSLYGPGTSLSAEGETTALVRRGKLPLVGTGAGIWSFVHVDDAAQATKIAIERRIPGVFNVVDDEPADVATWLPYLAELLGAPAPRHVPAWVARFAIGEAGVAMMTSIRGSSNEKAKRILHWLPRFPTWRLGFQELLQPELTVAERLRRPL